MWFCILALKEGTVRQRTEDRLGQRPGRVLKPSKWDREALKRASHRPYIKFAVQSLDPSPQLFLMIPVTSGGRKKK